MARRYRKPRFPYPVFVLVDENGVDDGPYRADGFAHAGGNVWACQDGGSPTFLRVTRQRGDKIRTVDGAGVERVLTMHPVELGG